MGSKRSKKSTKRDLEHAIKDRTDDDGDDALQELQVNNLTTSSNLASECRTVHQKSVNKRKKIQHVDDTEPVTKKQKKLEPPETSNVHFLNGETSVKASPKKKKNNKQNGLAAIDVSQVNGVVKSEPNEHSDIYNKPQLARLPEEQFQNEILKRSPVLERKKINSTWPDEVVKELFNQIEKQIPDHDTLAYKSRVEKIEWDKVAFREYSGEECKKTWCMIQKKMRGYRLMREVLTDARQWINIPVNNRKRKKSHKRHPDMPRRPLSSYLLFYSQNKDDIAKNYPGMENPELTKIAGQLFRKLPAEKREEYEKLAANLKDEYLEKRRIFLETHPESNPDPVKVEPIDEDDLSDFQSPKPTTSTAGKIKVEKSAKPGKTKKEKPIKPPKPAKPEKPKRERLPSKFQTPFGIFFASQLESMPEGIEKSAFKEQCKNQYKTMPAVDKVQWIELAEQSLIRYQKEAQKYKETHPDYQISKTQSVLTKDEKQAKDRAAGKPVKPANSAYGLYSRLLLKSDEMRDINPKDRMNIIANRWKDCSEAEKNIYRDKVVVLNDQYKQQYAAYVETLPEEEKQKLKSSKAGRKPRSGRDKDSAKSEAQKVSRKKLPDSKPAAKRRFEEPEQPPISACKYFATVFEGEGDAQQAWKGLSAEDKKYYEEELYRKKQYYIVQFEKFLKSLSKEELEAYSNSRQQQVKSDDEDDSSGWSSTSDEDDDGEENQSDSE